mmetsp:Transcript_66396/g.207921  ORF Transcript_66396/g.207921 Transcript_66396/m.207921 type:complete len:334 (-) Transcript_66396:489-1490(-)
MYSGVMPRAVGIRTQTFSKAVGCGKNIDRNSFSLPMLPDLSQPVSSSSVTSKMSISVGGDVPAQAQCPKLIFCLTTAPLVPKDAAWGFSSFVFTPQNAAPPSVTELGVFHTRSKLLCGFHFSLKRPCFFQRREACASLGGGFGALAAPRSSAGEGPGSPSFTTTLRNSSVASTAALNSSRVMLLSWSLSINWNRALTCSGHRAESLTTLCSPIHSSPAASSALLMRPSRSLSNWMNASPASKPCDWKAQRNRAMRALTVRSSNSSALTKTLATGNCWWGFCARRLHARTSSHQGSRSSVFVCIRDRRRMLRSLAWKPSALLAKRSSCSPTSSW